MNRLLISSFLIPAVLAVSGCSAFKDEEKPKLVGPRIDVTLQPTELAPSASAGMEAFQVPPAAEPSDWAQTAGNAAHQPGHLALPKNVTRAWSFSMGGGSGSGSAILNPPVISAGRVFATNTNAEVVALDAKTGKKLWERRLPLDEKGNASVSGGVAVAGNLLFVTTGEGKIFALTASTGKEAWRSDLGVPLRAAPTVEGERLFVTSHDNRVFGLNALDGSLLWTHSGMEERLSLLRAASPASANGVVAVPYSSGEIYALRATDGRYIWHDTLTSPFSGQDPESTLTSIAAPPVIADGLLYVVGMNGGLSAYGLANGQRFWKADILTSQLPIVVGYQIFALTENGEMVALNRKDGAIRWVTDLNKKVGKENDKRLWTGPVLAGGRLIAASSDGVAVSIDPQNGKVLASTDLGDPVTLTPIVAEDGLYFLSDKGRIICFRAK